MFALVWFKRRRKIVVYFCSTIIKSEVPIQLTICKLNKVYEMNIYKEYHLSSVRGNKQTNFSESLKILHK